MSLCFHVFWRLSLARPFTDETLKWQICRSSHDFIQLAQILVVTGALFWKNPSYIITNNYYFI